MTGSPSNHSIAEVPPSMFIAVTQSCSSMMSVQMLTLQPGDWNLNETSVVRVSLRRPEQEAQR